MEKELTSEEIVELNKKKLTYEIQDEILTWLKKRTAFVGLIFMIISLFGVNELLTNQVNSAIREPLKAAERHSLSIELLAEQTKKDAEKAESLASKSSNELQRVDKEIASLIGDFDNKLSEITLKSQEQSSHKLAKAELEIKQLSEEVKKLSSLVTTLSNKNSEFEESFKVYVSEKKAEDEKKQKEKKEFDKNSKFTIRIYYNKSRKTEAESLKKEILSKGYKIAIVQINKSDIKDDTLVKPLYTQKKPDEELSKEIESVVNEIKDLSGNEGMSETDTHLKLGETSSIWALPNVFSLILIDKPFA